MPSFRRRQFIAIEPEALSAGISLEALGLLAHITDEYATEALQFRFPDYDIDALVVELLGAGLVSEAPASAVLPVVEPRITVYVVEAGGAFKIGVTSNLKNRLKHLRTHAPYVPTLIWKRRFSDAAAIERRLHKQLMPFRTHGEWFQCARDILDRVLVEYGASEE